MKIANILLHDIVIIYDNNIVKHEYMAKYMVRYIAILNIAHLIFKLATLTTILLQYYFFLNIVYHIAKSQGKDW